jgi:hypothetical protein
MGGRGATSHIAQRTPQPTSTAQAVAQATAARVIRNFTRFTNQDADQMAALQQSYDINTRVALTQYIREDLQPNGYTTSQNLNHNLENGLPLNATEAYVASRLDAAMHPIGKDSTLYRAAHKDFLEALGVKNYETMTPAQLDAAIKGAQFQEKKFVSTAFDKSKNPFIGGYASGGREVYINIKAPAEAQCVLGNQSQAEVILARGTTFRATGARFDGTYATPRTSSRPLPRVIVDVEVVMPTQAQTQAPAQTKKRAKKKNG